MQSSVATTNDSFMTLGFVCSTEEIWLGEFFEMRPELLVFCEEKNNDFKKDFESEKFI